MKFIEVKTYEELSEIAANIIAAQVTLKPDCVLGLATGSTPVGTYKKLAEKNKAGIIDFSAVKTVNLDEYAGLDGTHDQSYRYFMNKNLFDNINIILSLLSVVYLIMMLAVTIKYASLGKTKVVNDPQTLEVGYFSKKHRKQVYLVLGLSFLVAVAVIFLFDMLLETGIFVAMLMAFPVIFIFILVGNVLVNPLQKAIKKFL